VSNSAQPPLFTCLMYPLRVRLVQKLNQKRFRNQISVPYISQHFFRSLADIVISKNNIRELTGTLKLQKARVIYCFSDVLKDFLESNQQISSSLIFSGSTDLTIDYDLNARLPNGVERIYVQNSKVSDNKRIFTLPIGLEDLQLGLNGNTKYLMVKRTREKKCDKIMVGPFSQTHTERLELLRSASISPKCCVYDRTLTPRQNAKASRLHRLVICPRGNGLDSHRLWETLYRGNIPILKSCSWSRSLGYLGVPMIFIQSWDPENLSALNATQEPIVDSKSLPSLWAPYWNHLVASVYS
jgi:hypothetical protein